MTMYVLCDIDVFGMKWIMKVVGCALAWDHDVLR